MESSHIIQDIQAVILSSTFLGFESHSQESPNQSRLQELLNLQSGIVQTPKLVADV